MSGVGKKSQNWSLEVIIALSIFLVIFVLVSVFLYYIPEDRTIGLELKSQRVISTLENDVLLEDGQVMDEGLVELSGYTCEDFKDLFAVAGDVCIHFEDLDGYLIEVEGKTGFGCEGITFENGQVCGGS